MDSTLICAATPAPTCAPAVVDALVLPAGTAAPAALVIAVESWLSQETSARGTDAQDATGLLDTALLGSAAVLRGTAVLGGTKPVAHHAAAVSAPSAAYAVAAIEPAMSFRNRNDVQGSPPRGTPV